MSWPPKHQWPWPPPPMESGPLEIQRYAVSQYCHHHGGRSCDDFRAIFLREGPDSFRRHLELAQADIDRGEREMTEKIKTRAERRLARRLGMTPQKPAVLRAALVAMRRDLDDGVLEACLRAEAELGTGFADGDPAGVARAKQLSRDYHARYGRPPPGYLVAIENDRAAALREAWMPRGRTIQGSADMYYAGAMQQRVDDADVLDDRAANLRAESPETPESLAEVLARNGMDPDAEKIRRHIAETHDLTEKLRYDRVAGLKDPTATRKLIEQGHQQSTETMRLMFAWFVEFCETVRGYDAPKFLDEPGAHLMALGRIHANQAGASFDLLAQQLADLEERRARWRGFEDLAPNAEPAYRYLASVFEQQDDTGVWLFHFAREWARCGFPTVELAHRAAASLMFTHGSPDAALEPPFGAFIVKIPNGLVMIPNEPTGRPAELARAYVWAPTEDKPGWHLRLVTRLPGGDEIQHGLLLRSLDEPESEIRRAAAATHGSQDLDQLTRAIAMAARLVAGACMLVSGRDGVEQATWRPKKSKTRRRPPGVEPPEGTRFVVSKNVEIDLREQVREYIAGRTRAGSKLTCQFVVRGHRRNQACGPRHSERREIWIKPFWKGSEDARALLRGYEIKQEDPKP